MLHLRDLDLPVGGHALDFGCGVGRLSVALADYYDRVSGVDISDEMIARAIPRNGVRYFQADSIPVALRFDLVYSMVVLQHMPRDLQHEYVSDFFRVLKPGGVAMFHIPEGPDTGHPGWALSMYGTPQATVEEWIAAAGGRLVSVEDLGTDASWKNFGIRRCSHEASDNGRGWLYRLRSCSSPSQRGPRGHGPGPVLAR